MSALPPELLWDLLLKLDYPDLLRTCRVDQGFYSICGDDSFWKAKVQQDFGVAEYKPHGTYHQQYDFLYRIPPVKRIPLDLLLRADSIALLSKRGVAITEMDIKFLIDRGRLDILQFLHQHGYKFGVSDANWAIDSGDFSIIKWLSSIGVRPSQGVVSSAVASDNVQLLDWLLAQGYNFGRNSMEDAAMSCATSSMGWLEERGILPTVNEANLAASYDCTSVLDWLFERDIFPDEGGIEAGYEYLDTAEWLAEHGFYL